MARKSNKTSHVLNLLAGEEPVQETSKEEPQKEETQKNETPAPPLESADKKEAAADVPDLSIITTGNGNDDSLSNLIREQLEEDFSKMDTQAPPDGHHGGGGGMAAQDSAAQESAPQPDTADTTAQKADTQDSLSQPDFADVTAQEANTKASVSQPDLADITAQDGTEHLDSRQDSVDSRDSMNPAAPEDGTPGEAAADELPPEGGEIQSSPPEDAQIYTASAEKSDHTGQDENTDADKNSNAPKSTGGSTQQGRPSPTTVENLDKVLYPEDDEDSAHYRFVNVMEYVVKDMVLDYMHKFGMCTCERCVVDTMALALTFCSSKYIVVDKHTVSPLLNYYANKYTGDVTVALTRACTLVNESPRH